MLLLLKPSSRGDARKRLLKVHRLHSVRLVDGPAAGKRSVWRHRYVRSWHVLVRHRSETVGNVLEGPLRDRIADGGNPRVPRADIHPTLAVSPIAPGKVSLGA